MNRFRAHLRKRRQQLPQNEAVALDMGEYVANDIYAALQGAAPGLLSPLAMVAGTSQQLPRSSSATRPSPALLHPSPPRLSAAPLRSSPSLPRFSSAQLQQPWNHPPSPLPQQQHQQQQQQQFPPAPFNHSDTSGGSLLPSPTVVSIVAAGMTPGGAHGRRSYLSASPPSVTSKGGRFDELKDGNPNQQRRLARTGLWQRMRAYWSVEAEGGGSDGGRLHLYQLVSPSLVGRAKHFGNVLALREEWAMVNRPYFSAPGAKGCARWGGWGGLRRRQAC